MAYYTYTERYNLRNGITPISAAVSEKNRVSEIIYQMGSDISKDQLTLDTVITSTGTGLSMRERGVSQAQLSEWCKRSLNGQTQDQMYSLILDDYAYNGCSTDTSMVACVRRCIWASAKLIGTGSF